MEKKSGVEKAVTWLEALAKGVIGGDLEASSLAGLQIVEAREGFIRCKFTVPMLVTDEDGNWQVGAMATLIDDVGAAAICCLVDHVKASVDFNISFYSTAKIQEEVEIEAKVLGDMGKLTSVQVEIRRKDNGELIASAKQWMASTVINANPLMRRSKL